MVFRTHTSGLTSEVRSRRSFSEVHALVDGNRGLETAILCLTPACDFVLACERNKNALKTAPQCTLARRAHIFVYDISSEDFTVFLTQESVPSLPPSPRAPKSAYCVVDWG